MQIEVMLTILAMAAVTFVTRSSSQILLGSTSIPPWFERLLKHVPTAILTALITPAIFAPQGIVSFAMDNPYLIAGITAAFLAYRRQSPIVTMGGGMVAMLAMRSLAF